YPLSSHVYLLFVSFCFNDPAPPDFSTLSLHDALPILLDDVAEDVQFARNRAAAIDRGDLDRGDHAHTLALTGFESLGDAADGERDRKSTRLNSSHQIISYAVFCLKKKKRDNNNTTK